MQDNHEPQPRRKFLIHSVTSAAGVASLGLTQETQAQAPEKSQENVQSALQGYLWLRPNEQGFVESLVNHMCPADRLSPSGVDMNLNIYFDRALGGDWGQGNRLYLKGPFVKGTPNQGYQLGLTPAALFRAGTEGLDSYCKTQFKTSFESLGFEQKEKVLKEMQAGKIELPNGIPSEIYFSHLLQMFNEAMFADPIYGGNKAKMGWKMIGYPGVNTNHRQNIVKFKNKPYKVEHKSISDVS